QVLQSHSNFFRWRFVESLAQPANRTFPGTLVGIETLAEGQLTAHSAKESLASFFWEFCEWQFWIGIEVFDDRQQSTFQICGPLLVHGSHEGELVGSNVCIRNQLRRINFQDCAQ